VSGLIDTRTVRVAPPAKAARPTTQASIQLLYLIVFIGVLWACNAVAMATASEQQEETLEALVLSLKSQMQLAIGRSLAIFLVVILGCSCTLLGLWLAGLVQGVLPGEGGPGIFARQLMVLACFAPLLYALTLILVAVCYRMKTYQTAMNRPCCACRIRSVMYCRSMGPCIWPRTSCCTGHSTPCAHWSVWPERPV
jgi:ABC-type Na+ efflux pump permease subunit